MDERIKEAVVRLWELKRLNTDWNFMFCAKQVASWHNVDLGILLSAYKKGGKVNKKVKSQEEIKTGKDGWPIDTPWWVKK